MRAVPCVLHEGGVFHAQHAPALNLLLTALESDTRHWMLALSHLGPIHQADVEQLAVVSQRIVDIRKHRELQVRRFWTSSAIRAWRLASSSRLCSLPSSCVGTRLSAT